MNQLVTLSRFNLGNLEGMLRDVGEDQMAHQPWSGANPPAWIAGHLAVVYESIGARLGGAKTLPESWGKEFGVKSRPEPEFGPYPPKEELLAAVRDRHDAMVALFERASPETLAAPNPFAGLARALPTLGDLVAHVLTTHAATHLGQLSAWRRAMGHGPLI